MTAGFYFLWLLCSGFHTVSHISSCPSMPSSHFSTSSPEQGSQNFVLIPESLFPFSAAKATGFALCPSQATVLTLYSCLWKSAETWSSFSESTFLYCIPAILKKSIYQNKECIRSSGLVSLSYQTVPRGPQHLIQDVNVQEFRDHNSLLEVCLPCGDQPQSLTLPNAP